MSRIIPENTILDYFTSVKRGLVPGQLMVSIFSRNADIDLGVSEDIIAQGGTWAQPTASRIHAIVSTSANDAAAGTGARTVHIEGLSNGVISSETVTLNGVTPVNTVNSYEIIYEMEVITVGSGGSNAGVLTATAAVDATVTIQIPIGLNETELGVYQVPTGYTGYILSWVVGFQNASGTATCDFTLNHKNTENSGWQQEDFIGLSIAGSSNYTINYEGGLTLDGGSLIKSSALASVNNSDCYAKLSLLLVRN